MQGFEILLMILVIGACQPSKKTQDSAVESEPAVIGAEPTPEPAPQPSADQKPRLQTCLAKASPPRLLSETGCVDPNNPARPAASVVPYDVIAPLWSDGSAKQRFLAVPDERKAAFNEKGDLDLPVGSVAIKIFELQGRPVETRLYMKESFNRWKGYSYEWRDDGLDAELLTAGKEKVIGDQTWIYPSPQQCEMCHNKATNITLGLSYNQLAKGDQISVLEKAGILDIKSTPVVSALVDYTDKSEPIDARARSYLQGNCAYCHQPQGGGVGNFDFRIEKDFVGMGICNKAPLVDVFPVTDGKIYKPGVPSESILLLRMKDTGDFHMPPQVSLKVDPEGTQLMEQWILLRSSCDL
jgi:uncharacterized repeat protein (TIGR03806 family)